jgi:FHS family L-fucose permease-like MFS transporter
MTVTARPSETTRNAPAATGSNFGPLAVVTTLFFMWGALTSLNDVLIPYAQRVFHIGIAASMLIQTAFFSGYLVFSIPAAKIIDWLGYKRAILVGLGLMVVACLMFYPAAKLPSFGFFLAALIVLACGITNLQVAANPFVAVLGEPRTASSRLNLTQAFNSLGTTIFPWIGAHLIMGTATVAAVSDASHQANAVVRLYCYFFTVALVLLGVAIAMFRFPAVDTASHHIGEHVSDSIWQHKNLVFGAICIFVYVGAEVSIGSSIANYLSLDNIGHLITPDAVPDTAVRYRSALGLAARYISLYWGGAMVGRFVGSALLQKMKPRRLLAFNACMAILLVVFSVASSGHAAMWSILLVGLFNSIMFPTIFTLGIAELGPLTGDASGVLNMAIVGGAIIPLLVGKVAAFINRAYYPAMMQGETSWGQGIHYALLIPAVCYGYILFFALSGAKPNSERNAVKG